MQQLDKTDIVIMSHFRNNARKNLTSISKETSIPVSTLFCKLKRYEETIITKHASLIDFSKLGFNSVAKVLLKAKKEGKNELLAYLEKNENVNSISKITNGYDYLVEVVFRSMRELETFLENLDEKYKIEKKSVFYVVDDIKREDFMSDCHMLP